MENEYKSLNILGFPLHRINNKGLVESKSRDIWVPMKPSRVGNQDRVFLSHKNKRDSYSTSYLFYVAWSGIYRPISVFKLYAKDKNYLNFDVNNFEFRLRGKKEKVKRTESWYKGDKKLILSNVEKLTKNIDSEKYKLLDFTGYKGFRIDKSGVVESCKSGTWKEMKGCITTKKSKLSYREVHFSNNIKDSRTFPVYYLFYVAWTGNSKPSNKYYLYIKDGNNFNYNVDNFEWKLRRYAPKKFNLEIATKMREEYSKGNISATKLGKIYNMSKSSADSIVTNRIYTDPNYTFVKSNYNHKRKLTDQQIEEIRELFETTSLTQKEIAFHYDINQSWVSQIIKGKHRVNKTQ